MVAGRAGDFLEPERHIGLGSGIELHIDIDRKGIEALLAETSPVPVSSLESLVDGKAGLFADGTGDRIQALFDFLLCEGNHSEGGTFLLRPARQYSGWRN